MRHLVCVMVMVLWASTSQAQQQPPVDPDLRRYADMLIELFGRRNPPILHDTWLVKAAVATRHNLRATLKDVPDLRSNDFPRANFYDEIRTLFMRANVFAPRRDDYRQLVACMAAREQFVLVEEHFRLLERLPIADAARREAEDFFNPENNRSFSQNYCRTRIPSDGTEIGNLSAAARCIQLRGELLREHYLGPLWERTKEAVFFFYRPLDFCIANVRTRDFLKDSPVRID